MKVLENKMPCPFEPPKDVDEFKMNSIELEFQLQVATFVFKVIHFVTVFYIRGLKFNLFDVLLLGKPVLFAIQHMLDELSQFLEYRVFLGRLNSRMIKKTFTEESEEICPICQEHMVSGKQLVGCPHIYHHYCIMKYV